MGLLTIIGLCIFCGVIGAWIFQKLHIPQVVGYIVIGVLIGESGLRLVDHADILALRPFNLFALGLIGFLVGGELHGSIFKKYGKQFTAILLGEGLAAFFMVGTASTLIVQMICHDWVLSLAAGTIFGAIASATDPASTIDVLWEYRTAGVLTSAIVAIVALDDALAMTLYGIGTSAAQMLTSGEGALGTEMTRVFIELFGAVALGLLAGFCLNLILRFLPQKDRRLGLALGVILLTISAAVIFKMDVILATMSIGILLTNIAPRRSKELFAIVRSFSSPIYILFFVLVGARLGIRDMPLWLWWLVAAYVIMRSLGKWIGSYWGGRLSRAEPVVSRYMGLTLFAQGGVAVGLSIMASQHLNDIAVTDTMSLGDMIVFTVTATTLVVQLVGPPCTRAAVRAAKEIDRNITEEDVIAELTVGDVMNPDVQPIPEDLPLSIVLQRFTDNDALVYPVVSTEGRILGVLTFESLKELLGDSGSWQWLVASDVMQPVEEKTRQPAKLAEVLDDMNRMQIEALPVTRGDGTDSAVGVLDLRYARRRIREELIHRTSAA
ncbi:cation:proton antiporter domain-containing protein [Tichowtungia aerotolerans]|uniref:CBS domain-containing protein n=1 Tax=Tichowtungia aerotolerans TaxID=2697043 RepID=A0A6P1MH70_9BACT|nr:cation:proton antiporter [Tichowtungia aerotolerans]QHI70425.1 CBS domain-containing protein [Tichowtungia aerotolerans]